MFWLVCIDLSPGFGFTGFDGCCYSRMFAFDVGPGLEQQVAVGDFVAGCLVVCAAVAVFYPADVIQNSLSVAPTNDECKDSDDDDVFKKYADSFEHVDTCLLRF